MKDIMVVAVSLNRRVDCVTVTRAGGLTGLSKPRLAEELGEARVQAWRHGLRDRPPPMPANHPLDVSGDRNYADLESTPRTESLEDTMQRALPLWRERIEPDLRSGKTVLVVAHGNSLRGLVKHVDGVSDEVRDSEQKMNLNLTWSPRRRRRGRVRV